MSGLVSYAKIKPNKGKITAFGLTLIQLFRLVWFMLGGLRRLTVLTVTHDLADDVANAQLENRSGWSIHDTISG
jgi:hypothetical protein